MQKIMILVGLLLVSAGASAESASLLVYKVWERGIEPYISRMIVTADHVRLDEGDGQGGYTLFDRRQEILYNIDPEDRVVFVMTSDEPPPDENPALILDERVEVDEQAPKVIGKQPRNVALMANGELCSELVVIEGEMQEALDGLSELKLALARVQAGMMQGTPLGERSACDLAESVHAPDRSLQFGLPLQERNASRRQVLVDFSPTFEVEAELFELPGDYARRPLFAPAAF
jgi:hypothetical protein